MPEHFPRPPKEQQPTQFPLTVEVLFEHLPPEPTSVSDDTDIPQKSEWSVEGHSLEQVVRFLTVEDTNGNQGIAQKTVEYHITDAGSGRLDVQIQFHAPLVGKEVMDATVVLFTHTKNIPATAQDALQAVMRDFAVQHITKRYHKTPRVEVRVQPTMPQTDPSEHEIREEE